MAFACIYVPDFLVQAVVRGDPDLRDCPLALISGSPPLWSVVAANAAAFDAGIQVGMTKAQATQFCNVHVCPRSESQERAAHAALLDVAWSISPRVEDAAPDTLVLDLEGLASLFGADENIARELAQRVSRINLIPRIAVASNIEVAIHAARGFPGITIIPEGDERQSLSCLPVKALVADVEVLEVLERWGVDTFENLAALPVLQLSERLGQEGVRLHELARGERQRSLVLAQPSTRFAEEMELDDSVEELEPLSFLLGRLLDQLCARLEARAVAVQSVHVRFDLEPSFEKDFQRNEDSRKKPPAQCYVKTLSLPVPMRNPKTLLKLLRLQLQNDPPTAPIQKIRLTVDSAAPRVAQGGLFVPCAPDPERLELTIARLAKLVGESNVGSPELLDTHGADNFRMTRFIAPDERSRRTRQTRSQITALSGNASIPAGEHGDGFRITHAMEHERAGKDASASKKSLQGLKPNEKMPSMWELKLPPPKEKPKPVAGLRVMRPATPIRVELRDAKPARLWLQGMRGNVLTASGPWRSSGDWWQEDAWRHDEWDVEIEFASPRSPRESTSQSNKHPWPQYGVFRIYYDTLREGWFVRGIYD